MSADFAVSELQSRVGLVTQCWFYRVVLCKTRCVEPPQNLDAGEHVWGRIIV